MIRFSAAALAALFVVSTLTSALLAADAWEITVAAGQHDRRNVPLSVQVLLPADLADSPSITLVDAGGKRLAAQLAPLALLDHEPALPPNRVARRLHFVLAELKAGQQATFTATVSSQAAGGQPGFDWHDTAGEYIDLRFGDRPVMRYMYKAFDDSTKESRDETYKVYHHVFDPAGKQLVTKGPGGQYPHHRGLFFGFNNVSYEGSGRVDVWHCQGDNYQSHKGFLSINRGPVLGRHIVGIDWHGKQKKVFASEHRELTAYNVPGGQLVEFASRVRTQVGPVKLDGDPQHAGFHFRASNEVASSTKGQTYYLRPDGQDKPGATRNWPGNKDHVNLPWNAMSFVVGGQRYTAVYLDHPDNPKEARFSERDYGRFGSYFVYELTNNSPLKVKYRVWLQEGEMTGEQAAALSKSFTDPPTVTAKAKGA